MNTQYTKIDKSISFTQANIYSTLILPPILLVLIVPYLLIWGWERLFQGFLAFTDNFILLILILICGIILHEGLHGITWKITGRLSKDAVTYGIKWKLLTPYAHLKVPVTIETYRLGGLMPGIVLGFMPGLIGMITGSGWLLCFGVLFSLAAVGDIMVWWLLRDVPPNTLVEDHPEKIGGYLLVENNYEEESEKYYD